MAIRSSVSAVEEIIDTDLESWQIQAMLEDASLWVDEELVGEGLTASRLERIEKYLTAHLVTLRDPRLTRAKADDAEDTYQRDGNVSEYLKAAIALDPTGKLQGAFQPREGAFRLRFAAADGYSD